MIAARTLLLGCAAIIAGGAQAADLLAKTASPVDFVRIWSTQGNGFFYVPGTETCLRVSGRVRAEYLYLEPFDRSQDTIGFRGRGRINLDARTATAYGMLRTYIRMEMTRNTGAYSFSSTSPEISQAFVQFGGLTAGRAVSFFTSPDLPAPNFGDLKFATLPTPKSTCSPISSRSATASRRPCRSRTARSAASTTISTSRSSAPAAHFPSLLQSPPPMAVSACRTWSQTSIPGHLGRGAVVRRPASDP